METVKPGPLFPSIGIRRSQVPSIPASHWTPRGNERSPTAMDNLTYNLTLSSQGGSKTLMYLLNYPSPSSW